MVSVTGIPRWRADLAGLQYTLAPSPIAMVNAQMVEQPHQEPQVAESSLSKMLRSKGLGTSLVAAEALASILKGRVVSTTKEEVLAMLQECKRVTRCV